MDYRKFSFIDEHYTILMETSTQYATESKKSWSKVGTTTEYKVVTSEFYNNYITSIPFFNNFGYSASCHASWAYSIAGYLPTKVVTIAPERSKRITAKFIFINTSKAYLDGGYREKAILDNLATWEPFENTDRLCYTFIDTFGNRATYDTSFRKWVY